jgi:tetratricopeptide (TPR) repeat protein
MVPNATPGGPGLPRELPLVGRREELERLFRIFGHESQVEPMVLMTGDPGVGKSRMAKALVAEAERRGWTVAVGRAYPIESGMPYNLISDAFLPILRTFDEAQLTVLTRGTSGDIRRLFPALGGGDSDPVEGWDPGDARTRLFWSFTEFMKRLAERAPLLVVAEDLHWADPSSLSLLHFAARQLHGEPIRILGTSSRGYGRQPETLEDMERSLASISVLARYELPPLSLEATEELLRTAFQVEGSPVRDFASHLYGWTQGNPYFLEETLKSLVDSDRLYFRDGTWLGWDLEQLDLPGSVRDALLLKLRALSEPAREIADLIAVSGRRTPTRLLQRLSEMDADGVVSTVAELHAAGMIEEVEDGRDVFLEFRHPMLRETLYQDLGPSRRRLLHRRLADGLEAIHPGATAPVDQLAYHFERAGDPATSPRAARYLVDAGRSALDRHADHEAVAYLSTAVSQTASSELDRHASSAADAAVQADLARGLARLGRHDEAAALWRDLLSEAERREDAMATAQCLRHLGLVAFWNGRHEDALQHYDRALEVMEGAPDPDPADAKLQHRNDAVEARVRLAQGVALQELGRAEEARTQIERSLELARRLNDPMLLGRAHRALALLFTWIGQADEARSHGWQAVELADRAGDAYVRFWGRWALASLEGLTGNTREMATLVAQAAQVAEELRSPILKLWTAELEIEYHWAVGAWDTALAEGERAIRLATSLSQTNLLPRLLVWTATVYLGRGNLVRARELADRAWTLAGLEGDRADVHVAVPAYIGRVACLVAEDRYDEAAELCEAGVELADRAGYVFWSLHLLLPMLAEAHLRRRDLGAARKVGRRMRSDGKRMGHRLATAWADGCDAIALWLDGRDPERSIKMLRGAAESLERIPILYDAARIRRQLVGRLADAGRRDEAVSELRRVHQTFTDLGAPRELQAAREMFSELDARAPTRARPEGTPALTGREWEVAQCIAARMTNKGTAKQLGIRERTVTTNLTNIYRKLGIGGRDELADMVREGRLPAAPQKPSSSGGRKSS